MARMFLALWPDCEVRDALVAWRDAWSWPRSATPVRMERLHLTLHFIGEVERERMDELADALPIAFDRFGLRFGYAVLWPHGVAVLEPDAVPEDLVELRGALGAVLQRFALPVDARPFRPHVTMARRAAEAVVPPHWPAVDWQIDRFVLMESTDEGYEVVREYAASAARQTGI